MQLSVSTSRLEALSLRSSPVVCLRFTVLVYNKVMEMNPILLTSVLPCLCYSAGGEGRQGQVHIPLLVLEDVDADHAQLVPVHTHGFLVPSGRWFSLWCYWVGRITEQEGPNTNHSHADGQA